MAGDGAAPRGRPVPRHGTAPAGWFDCGPPELVAERMPGWRWTHIPNNVIPMLRDRGASDAEIEQMTGGNPRRIFGANEPC